MTFTYLDVPMWTFSLESIHQDNSVEQLVRILQNLLYTWRILREVDFWRVLERGSHSMMRVDSKKMTSVDTVDANFWYGTVSDAIVSELEYFEAV